MPACDMVVNVCCELRSLQIVVNPQLRNHVSSIYLTSTFSLILEPSEEELYVQAEPVNDERQDPAYLAEPDKPPSKIPLCPIILQSMFCFQK